MFTGVRPFSITAFSLALGTIVLGQTSTGAWQSPTRQGSGLGAVEKIVLLPVVDSRTVKTSKVNLQGMRKYTQKLLERRRYTVVRADSAPPGARWVMTVKLGDVRGRVPVASVSAFLRDVEGGEIVWSGSGSGTYQSAATLPRYGRMTMQEATADQLTDLTYLFLMPGAARSEALDRALINLLQDIPARPKTKKK